MALKKLMQGTPVQVTATFRVAGVLTNPTTTTFKMKGPSFGGGEISYVNGVDSEVANPSTGVFVGTFPSGTGGLHYARVVGGGAAAAAHEVLYEVYPSVYDSP